MAIDCNRAIVGNAFHRACISEGIERETGIWFMLCFWGCHRDDWDDVEIEPSDDIEIRGARKRVVLTTLRAAREHRERLPDAIIDAMKRWSEWRLG